VAAGRVRLFCITAVLRSLFVEELVKRLEDVFPPAPTRATPQREVDFWIGQQEVISYLRQLMVEQQDELLDLEAL
jgi:hypothetical protein